MIDMTKRKNIAVVGATGAVGCVHISDLLMTNDITRVDIMDNKILAPFFIAYSRDWMAPEVFPCPFSVAFTKQAMFP